MIDVAIFMKNGEIQNIQYYLSYELPSDDGSNYIAVDA